MTGGHRPVGSRPQVVLQGGAASNVGPHAHQVVVAAREQHYLRTLTSALGREPEGLLA